MTMAEKYPESLPTIDDHIEGNGAVLIQVLNEFYDTNQNATLIDEQLMMQPVMYKYIDALDIALATDEAPKNEASVEAITAAIHFTLYVNDLAGQRVGYINPTSYHATHAPEHIREDMEEYLENHPTFHGLLETYMPELDPTGKYESTVKTAAALMSVHIEDGVRLSISQFAQELDNWDGAVPYFD